MEKVVGYINDGSGAGAESMDRDRWTLVSKLVRVSGWPTGDGQVSIYHGSFEPSEGGPTGHILWCHVNDSGISIGLYERGKEDPPQDPGTASRVQLPRLHRRRI